MEFKRSRSESETAEDHKYTKKKQKPLDLNQNHVKIYNAAEKMFGAHKVQLMNVSSV